MTKDEVKRIYRRLLTDRGHGLSGLDPIKIRMGLVIHWAKTGKLKIDPESITYDLYCEDNTNIYRYRSIK